MENRKKKRFTLKAISFQFLPFPDSISDTLESCETRTGMRLFVVTALGRVPCTAVPSTDPSVLNKAGGDRFSRDLR